jgi:putative addiction module CopG family antidote
MLKWRTAVNIELSSDMLDFVRGLVVAGRFVSEQEAVAEALRLLKLREQVRHEVAEGFHQLDSGQWVDGDTVFQELDQEIDAIEKKHLGN